jgi:hypothetical protein
VHLAIVAAITLSLTTSLAAAQQELGGDRVKQLSSLERSCSVAERWIGAIPNHRTGLWLTCGQVDFLVTAPLNFANHVRITSPEQALEFVRFFSAQDISENIDLGGLMELLPGVPEDGMNRVDPAVFRARLAEATVKVCPASKSQENSPLSGKQFEVRRFVGYPNGDVFEIHEMVTEHGFYEITWRRKLKVKASDLGVHYMSVH